MKTIKKTVSFRIPEIDNQKLDIISQYTKFLLEKESDSMLELTASRSTALSYLIRNFYNENLSNDIEFIKYYLDDVVAAVPNRIMQFFKELAGKHEESEIFYTKSKKHSEHGEHYYALILEIKIPMYEDLVDYGIFHIVEVWETDDGYKVINHEPITQGLWEIKEKQAILEFFEI